MASMHELHTDEKGKASLTLGDVIKQTISNYPDPRFRPKIYEQTSHYIIAGIDPSPYGFWVTADGIGTKPELAERLYSESLEGLAPLPEVFESLAFDTLAMIDGDEARFGRYLVGVAEILDMNSAGRKEIVGALARGLKNACDEGQFALLNGETAELGYRTSGYGNTRVNWNAVGISVFNPEKLILGKDLQPGQPVVAFREKSIRSNGLSKARAILESAFLLSLKLPSKEDYVFKKLEEKGIIFDAQVVVKVMPALSEIFGHDASEQVLVPWHTQYSDVVRQLLMPSTLYGPIIREAQGKIDEPRKIGLVAAAHISGGGIPEKTRRMVESKGLGVDLDPVFPDPEGVSSLLKIADAFPEDVKKKVKIDDRIACEQWNRGIGFIVVAQDQEEAKRMVNLANKMNCEAKIAGETTAKPEVSWRGHKWSY